MSDKGWHHAAVFGIPPSSNQGTLLVLGFTATKTFGIRLKIYAVQAEPTSREGAGMADIFCLSQHNCTTSFVTT